jgi:hypothetical protein
MTRRYTSATPSAPAPTCYICVQPGADSRDHIIPSGLFPQPRPTSLVTLAAHHSCHNRLSEDYARAILAGTSGTATAARVNAVQVAWSLVRSDLKGTKLRRDLSRTLIPRIEFRSPSGLVLGSAPAIRFDRNRIYPLLEKIVRGLYHHHTKRFLPANVFFSWGLNERPVGPLETVFSEAVPGLSYPCVFECRYRIITDNTGETTFWWLRFYEGVIFRCITR